MAIALRLAAAAWAGWSLLACGAEPRDGAAEVGTAQRRQLAEIGYAEWVDAGEEPTRAGVTVNVPSRVYPGLNLYASNPRRTAHLMDMTGRVVHTWTAPSMDERWHHIELRPNGDLVAVSHGTFVERVDWDSRRVWRAEVAAHHDIDFDAEGRIYVLTEGLRRVEIGSRDVQILDNGIAILTPDGEVLREISLAPLFAHRISGKRIQKIARFEAEAGPDADPGKGLRDVFHTNTLEILDRDVSGLGRRGQILLCLRNLHVVAVVDPEAPAVVWSWGPGRLDRPHQPSVLDDGHLLVFDNGKKRGWSRLVELDPVTRGIVWEYRGDPERSFFSETRGGVQALPNGNRLVTDSNKGRAFELTPDGDVVWEFFNPDFDAERIRRGAIYRMTRIDADTAAQLPFERRESDPGPP